MPLKSDVPTEHGLAMSPTGQAYTDSTVPIPGVPETQYGLRKEELRSKQNPEYKQFGKIVADAAGMIGSGIAKGSSSPAFRATAPTVRSPMDGMQAAGLSFPTTRTGPVTMR